jgi:hypothetical protein
MSLSTARAADAPAAPSTAPAAPGTLKIAVTDSQDNPLAAAPVQIIASSGSKKPLRQTSDANGKLTAKLPPGDYTVVVLAAPNIGRGTAKVTSGQTTELTVKTQPVGGGVH